MTAPNGAILFNNSTGSDTTASGLGAANVYGSGASTTGSSAVVTGIDTTGVSSGDLLWVQSSSGRQYSIIFNVDSSTQVTCDDVFANTESGRTWAIGGKRATLDNTDSRRLFTSDIPFGATVEIEYTGTHYTFGSNTITVLRAVGAGEFDEFVTYKGTGSQRPRIQGVTGNAESIRAIGNRFLNLEFENRASTGQTFLGSGFHIYVDSCKFIDSGTATNGTGGFLYIPSSYNSIVTNSEFIGISGNFSNCAVKQYATGGWYGTWNIINCTFRNFINGVQAEKGSGFTVSDCLFYDSQNGVNFYSTTARGGHCVTGCVFHNLSGDGVKFDSGHSIKASSVNNSVFSNTTGNAISASSVWGQSDSAYFNHNAFYNINGSNYSNLTAGANDIALTADPFVDAANGDFNLNADAGGGDLLRANNFAINTGTSIYPFRQYVSDDFDSGAGGGGATVHPLRSN